MKKNYTIFACLMFFLTSNKSNAQVLIDEDFGSATGTTPPAGWNNITTAPGQTWAFNNPGGRTFLSPISSPAAIFDNGFNGWNGDYPEASLETPVFDASAITDHIFLSFDHTFDNDGFWGSGTYAVEVWDGAYWIEYLYGYSDVPGMNHVVLDITNDAIGVSNTKVRFLWDGDYSEYWVVDNVKIEVVSCLPVTDIVVDNATASSVGISWTAGGSETNWNVEYGMSGFNPGSGITGTATSTSFTAGSLTANTHYDFYVQADCGGGDESPWVGPITAFTGYCEFENSIYNDYFYINKFSTTGGLGGNISNLNSGQGSNGYEDATAMSVSQFEGGSDVHFEAKFSDTYTAGLGIWVDWNNNLIFEASEQVFQSSSYQNVHSGSFGVPAGVPVGSYTMRVLTDYDNSQPDNPCSTDYGYGEVEDYTFMVVPIPSCLPVTDLMAENETSASIDLTWTAGGGESSWNIEWGTPGFVPGTGTSLNSGQASATSFTVSGLNPATDYDMYVQAVCSATDSAYWIQVSGTTLCAPIASLPWAENFDAMIDLGFDLFPYCWVGEGDADGEDWYTDDTTNNLSYNASPYSGANFLAIKYYGDGYIWTPEFQLVAGTTYEFSFMWAGDDVEGWTGKVAVNNMQSSAGLTELGTFVTASEEISSDYRRAYYCFTPTTSGIYSFGVFGSSNGSPNNMTFDDFSLIKRGASAGTNGTSIVCQTEGLVDLNDIVTKDDQNGFWTFIPNPGTIVNDSLFNPQYVPAGTASVSYITNGCLEDTASAVITIFPPSTAGMDGMITVCKNEPVDLLSGLTGNVDHGGDWYDPQNALLNNSEIMGPNFPGQYNYKYIAGNGVCPNDSSSVVLTVTGCDWLSVDEMALEEMSVYPNPSTGLVFIESGFTSGTFDLEVLDVNGRIIETGNNSIIAGTNTIDLNEVQKGTYFFKLSNVNAEKVYRVVIR